MSSSTSTITTAFIIFGASGDLARKKVLPSLYNLHRDRLLPPNCVFLCYGRTNLRLEDVRCRLAEALAANVDQQSLNAFVRQCRYIQGDYDRATSIQPLVDVLKTFGHSNRLYYLALPPVVFESITQLIKAQCWSCPAASTSACQCWRRLVVEKPLGEDSASFARLTKHVASLYAQPEVYLIDHYLGKEVVQNILALRFANRVFEVLWSREHIASVVITFKETMGTAGRGGYFDRVGILRDVVQNHLMQVLSLLTMEKPASMAAGDILAEKVLLLRSIEPFKLANCVLGQYVAGEGGPGYRDDPTVAKDSRTPTYARVMVVIDNDRWRGVPIFLVAGKALDERVTQVRMKFKPTERNIFGGADHNNELLIRVQPGEAISLKVLGKTPGGNMVDMLEPMSLDLVYQQRFKERPALRDAYDVLLLDIVGGRQLNFVHQDEVAEAWRILTPLLEQIECTKVVPIAYRLGSSGPVVEETSTMKL